MKSASTNDRTEAILYDIVGGSRSKPLVDLQYFDDASTWQSLVDLMSLSCTTSNINREYSKFKLVPGVGTITASIDNAQARYSPGSGNLFDGVLIRNRDIRVNLGYQFNDTVSVDYQHPESNYKKLYHTKVSAGQIFSDISSGFTWLSLPGITDPTFYDGVLYDAVAYAYDGYYLSSVIDFTLYDIETLTSFGITADTTAISVYYRFSNNYDDLNDNTKPFTLLGNTSVGTSAFSLASLTERWFQFCLVYHTGLWGTGYAQDVTITYYSTAEYFTNGEYLIDDPSFASTYGDYKASFTGRDFFKKAFETEVTCPSYSGGVDVAEILRDVADRASIPHDNGGELIDDTGYSVTIADDDNFKNEQAIDIFNECMLYLNSKNINYRLELNDGYLQLVIKDATIIAADWLCDYRYSMVGITKSYLSDKLVQRFTVLTQEEIVDPEIQLATANYASVQSGTDLSWDNSFTSDAMYTRIVTSGTGTFTLNYVDLENKKINFDITGTVSMDVTVFGDELKNARTAYYGESIYYANQGANDGFTQKIINRLCQSDAECKALAEGLVSLYGAPNFQVEVTIPCNPLIELGDKIILWEKYTYTNTIYRVDSISTSYSADGASMTQTLHLTDLGIGISSFIWDANGMLEGTDDIYWDKAFLYDQDLGVSVTSDTTDYSSTKPVRFT